MAPSRERWPSHAALLLAALVILVLVGPGALALASAESAPDPEPETTALTLTGPASVVDEHSVTLRVSWTSSTGVPVVGPMRLWTHVRDGRWTPGPAVPPSLTGKSSISVGPRIDTWYQVRGDAGISWQAAQSRPLYVHNLPPALPVVLPASAPRPKQLPAQPRATAPGASATVSTIPDAVWTTMVGRSWRPGCPVGRSDLRYLQTNYWGFDGYRHRGELVVRAAAASKFVQAVQRLYDHRVPVRAMYLVDRFGYSKRSQGANDFASMRYDNTSAFNCRSVTGTKGVRSPHSYGRALDLNPFENPFHSAVGWLPNHWWARHANARYAWRSKSHVVVRIMVRSGFRWSYPTSDPQHFDG